MAPNTKRVFYVKYVAAPIFLDILATAAGRAGGPAGQRQPRSDRRAGADARRMPTRSAPRATRSRRIIHATASLLARAPNLLAVSSNGAGFDTVDVDACTAAGVIAVVNQAGGNKEAVAEHVLAMMLTLSKRIVETDRYMRRQSGIPRNDFIGHDLTGRTVGIIGLGNVGGRVAELCRGLFRMRVLAYDPYLTRRADRRARGGEGDAGGAAGAGRLRVGQLPAQRRDARHDRRGAVRDDAAARLFHHDRARRHPRRGGAGRGAGTARIAGAGLDVWEKEPPPHTHPLMAFDNVVVSPHTAGVTVESRTNIARIAAEQMLDILDGKRPERLLNPEAWPAYRARFERILGFSPPR